MHPTMGFKHFKTTFQKVLDLVVLDLVVSRDVDYHYELNGAVLFVSVVSCERSSCSEVNA